MRKFIFSLVAILMTMGMFGTVQAENTDGILYQDFITNFTVVGEANAGAINAAAISNASNLMPGDYWSPIDPSLIQNAFPVMDPIGNGYIYYSYTVKYEDGTDDYNGTESLVSFEHLDSLSQSKIIKVYFHYSFAAKVTVNYKLETEDGTDLKESVDLLGRFAYVNPSEAAPGNSHAADRYLIDDVIEGYEVKEVIGNLEGDFTIDNQEVTIIYTVAKEPEVPVDPVEPELPVDPEVPGETVDPVVPKEKDVENPIVDLPKDTPIVKDQGDTLPPTGISNSLVYPILFLLSGFIVVIGTIKKEVSN